MPLHQASPDEAAVDDVGYVPHVLGPNGCACGWEQHQQAFHWFPALSAPIPSLPSNNPFTPPSPDPAG